MPMASGEVHRRLRADRARRRLRRRRDADDRPPRGRRPTAARWVIDGGKRFITNAGQAGTYIVTARTGDDGQGRRRDQRLHRARRHARLLDRPARGQDGAARVGDRRADLRRLPDPRRRTCSASRATGFRTFLKILDGGRISIAALAVGLAQAALDAAIPYAQEREQFGRPIGTFQGVAFMVADMATEIEAARALVWRAAWLKDQGRDYSARGGPGEAVRVGGQQPRRRTPRSRSTAATATSRSTRSSASCATRS